MGIKRRILTSLVRHGSNLLPDKARHIFIDCLIRIKRVKYNNEDIFIKCASGWEFARADSASSEEPETIKWIEDRVKPGEIFYDVGANIGIYSLIAAKYSGAKIKIYSFEPSFPTFKSLCENVGLNNLQNVIIPLNIALSDMTGLGEFHYSSLSAGDSQHTFGGRAELLRAPALSLHCLSYRIDDLIRQLHLEPPDHIKIDVDGIELKILSGAAETLGNSRLKSLLVENNEDSADSHKITELLGNHGFKLYAKHRHKAAQQDRHCRVYNLIFTR